MKSLRWIMPPLILAALVTGAVWWFQMQSGPRAPRPIDVNTLDPQVSELVTLAADAVDSRPGDAIRRIRLGMVYEANELYGLAVRCYEQALERRPSMAKVWFRLATVREREGDLDGAIFAMRESVRQHDDFAPSHARLASWLLDAGGDLEEAATSIEKARLLDATGQEPRLAAVRLHLRERQPREALQLIHDHALTEGANSAYGYHLQVIAHRMLGDLAAANAILPKARAAEPRFADPWTKEVAQFRTGIARQRSVAGLLIKRGEFYEALPVLEEIREQDPGDERVLNMLAQCYLRTNAPEQALEALEAAVEAAPQNFGSNLNLVKVSMLMVGRMEVDYEYLLGYADRAIELRPNSGEAHLTRGSVLTKLGRAEEALSMFRRAWELDARDPSTLLRAAGLLSKQGRWREAGETCSAVLEIYPGHPGAILGRARTEMELGDYDRAEQTLASLGEAAAEQPAVKGTLERLRELRGAKG